MREKRARAISRLLYLSSLKSDTWQVKKQGERARDRDKRKEKRDGKFILVLSRAA
jgi:hypothetical protein